MFSRACEGKNITIVGMYNYESHVLRGKWNRKHWDHLSSSIELPDTLDLGIYPVTAVPTSNKWASKVFLAWCTIQRMWILQVLENLFPLGVFNFCKGCFTSVLLLLIVFLLWYLHFVIGLLEKSDLDLVVEELDGVSAKWYTLGLNIGVYEYHLERIHAQHSDYHKLCLREMLRYCLEQEDYNATWRAIVVGLRKSVDSDLADALEAKYCSGELSWIQHINFLLLVWLSWITA